MQSREISLWIDERFAAALENELPGHDLQKKLEEVLDGLVKGLPEHIRAPIEREIRAEDEKRRQEHEASRRFSAIRVTENGRDGCYVTDDARDLLRISGALRRHMIGKSATLFDSPLKNVHEAGDAQFRAAVMECIEGTGRVAGVYKIDLDTQILSTLDAADGWHEFRFRDLSTAAWAANRKAYESPERRQEIFAEKLRGREITTAPKAVELRASRPITGTDFLPTESIEQMGSLLNFYLAVNCDPDTLFGLRVATDDNDDYINVYVNYDMGTGEVVDRLDITLCRGGGSNVPMEYRLTDDERSMLLTKMRDYCQRCGTPLDVWRERYLEELKADAGLTLGTGQSM